MYLQIANFRYGLDTRRAELSSVAGTLAVCKNAVINQGGEVEKRRAFVQIADLNILDTDGHPAVFGLLAVGQQLVAFGSAYPPYAPPEQRPRLTRFPSNIQYQQLLHPAVRKGATYDPAVHRMTAIRAGTVFANKPWVIAAFGEAPYKHYIAFHGDEPVPQWHEGLVLPGRGALDQIAEDIAEAILREKPEYSVEARPASVVVRSPKTRTLKIQARGFDPELYLAAEEQAVPSVVTGTPAVAVVKFSAGGSGAYISSVYVGGSYGVYLANQTVPFYNTLDETVRRLAALINNNTYGFRATASGLILRVFSPVGTRANGAPLIISHSGFTFEVFNESNPPPATPLSASISPSTVLDWVKNGNTVVSRVPVRLTIAGGVAPYTIQSWNFSLPTGAGVTMSVPNTASTENQLTATLANTGITSFSGSLTVTVKDANNDTVTSNVVLFSWVDSGTPTGGATGGSPTDREQKNYL